MKKILLFIVGVLVIACIFACEEKPGESSGELTLTADGDILTCLDVSSGPFEGAGIRTNFDKNAGTVTFVKTSLEGTDTVDYYQFTPANNQMVKYYYVSAMGTGYYYYYDITAGEVVMIENNNHEDTTESVKSSGRFDSANETVKGEYASLTEYFSASFGMTIEDAVK